MQAAHALIAEGPAPRRRRNSPLPWILLGSAAAHLLVLAGLAVGVQVMPALVEPPVLSVELLGPAPPPAPPIIPPQAQEPLKAAAPVTASPTSAQVAVPPAASAAAPTPSGVPPGFKARGLTGGGEALREATRDAIGCRNADELALTKAQKAACAEALGEKARNAPLYAVIDPDKKAIFDKVCAKDDAWCLYRSGKGPYPGIFALGQKKKPKGWD